MRVAPLALFLLFAGFSFAWLDPSFQYRSAINISNPGSALTDYQVQIAPSVYNNTGLIGSWHFSEGSGTRAADSSGIGNDGTLNGFGWTSSSNWTQGKFGSGIQFDGLDDNVDAGNAASLNSAFDGSYTVEMWVKTSSAEALKGLFEKRDTGTGSMMAFFNYPSAGKVKFYSGSNADGDALDSATSNLNNGLWRHLVFQLDGTTQRIYVDGVLDNSRTKVGGTSADGTFRIGRLSTTYFNGTIDEVRIYNRSLSAQEISDLYNASKARLDYADLRFTQPYNIYETPISISAPGSNLTDYQVLVNITNATILSHMRSDGADLRFFSSSTSTPYSQTGLSYWIESINSSQAKVWVKANILSGGSTIYMYYGNVSASAQSNGSATFLFFDDFSGDLSKWNQNRGSVSLTSDGQLNMSVTSSTLVAKSSFPYPLVQKTRIKGVAYTPEVGMVSNSAHASELWNSNPTQSMIFYLHSTPFYIGSASSAAYTESSLSGAYRDFGYYHEYEQVWDGASYWLRRDGALISTKTDNIPTASLYPAFALASYAGGGMYVDYVLVRKYSSTEPSASVGSESAISSGSEAPLPYWLESDISAWVKVPSLPAGISTVYSYYGSPSAASSSNGSATFDFFDDFSGASVDTSRWKGDTGKASLSNGILAFNGGGVDSKLISTQNFAPPRTIQFRNNVPQSSWSAFGFQIEPYASPYQRVLGYADSAPSNFLTSQDAAEAATPTNWVFGSYTRKVIKWDDANSILRWYQDGIELSGSPYTNGANIPDEALAVLVGRGITTTYTDYVFMRKYSSSEPSSGLGAVQAYDFVPPSVSVSSPVNSTYSSISVPLNFTASDSSGISQCKYELNGVNTTLSGCLNTTMTAQSGSNSLTVWASDGANWGSASVSFNVSLDTTPPGISISSPANVSYSSASVPVTFVVSDASGVSSCVVRLNGTVNSSSCSNYSLLLGNGAYTLNVSANDTFGNANSSAVSFSVSILASVSNSTITNSNGIGNVSLSGIPPAASRIVYSVGSNQFSKSFTVSPGVSTVRISALATLSGSPVSGKTLAFEVS